LGRRPLGAVLHSSNEPGELSQWLCHDDRTINIVLDIIFYYYHQQYQRCVAGNKDTPVTSSCKKIVPGL